jgi:DNA cross-link repair 1A protein
MISPSIAQHASHKYVIRTYSIGKERIVKAVAQALNSRIYCDERKRKLFECLEDQTLMQLLDNDPHNCSVHVMPLQTITSDRLLEYLECWKGRWDKVLGFRPTGWTLVPDARGNFGLSLMDYRYTPPAGTDTINLQNIINRDQKRVYNWASLRPMRNSSTSVMLYGVPYSEHRFADLCRPSKHAFIDPVSQFLL